jgi:SH3-like domain-containing protein
VRPSLSLLLLAAAAGFSANAQALEFRSVARPAILYDAPSESGRKLFVIRPGTPVETVVTLEKWAKVRDMGGGLTWIERNALSDRHTLQVSAARAQVRQSPDEAAPLAFEAAKDVVLEQLEPPSTGWIKVKHRDGATGYVRVGDIWGL